MVKRRLHFRHSRRRRIRSPVRASRESTTLSSRCAQNGHFTGASLLCVQFFSPTPRIHSLRPLVLQRWPYGVARPWTSLLGTTKAHLSSSSPRRLPAIG